MRLSPQQFLSDFDHLGPSFSIVMPVYNTAADVLDVAIQSVLSQTYARWELCICDDASTSAETLAVLQRYKGVDWRIRILRSEINLHISGASNRAAELATGDFIGFLDHDDALEPQALETVVSALAGFDDVDLIYTDEDKLTADDVTVETFLKPDYSPDYLQSVMYVLHFYALRKSLFAALGGFREQFSGAQDYDLALRAARSARRVLHVPAVLYHWRMVEGSAAAVVDAKPQALLNARSALQDAVSREDSRATVDAGLSPGTFRVRWPPSDAPVTLVILTNSGRRLLERGDDVLLIENFLVSIERSTRTCCDYRLLVVDNGNLPPETRALVESSGGKVFSFSFDGDFNYSEKANFAVALVETEAFVLLNDDLEVVSPDWLDEIAGQISRPSVGAVGARLTYENGAVQHAGVVLGPHEDAAHIFHSMNIEECYAGWPLLTRNYSAVTGAVLGTTLAIWNEVGGFDPGLGLYYNDIDYCLRVGATGRRIVYTPHAHLNHYEGSTVTLSPGSAARRERERARFLDRWGALVRNDPFYHPDLPRDRVDIRHGFSP